MLMPRRYDHGKLYTAFDAPSGSNRTVGSTTKSTAGYGAITLRSRKKASDATGAVGADANLVVIQAETSALTFSTRFIFDAEGEMHSDAIIGVGDDWDEYDDLVLAADLSRLAQGQWDEVIRYNAEDFERAGLVTLSVDEEGRQHAFIKHKAFLQFYACVFRDVYQRVSRLEQLALSG